MFTADGLTLPLQARHNALERWALNTTMKRSVVAGARSVGDPPPFSDEMFKDGFEHYDEMCTVCHGGPGIERSEICKGLNPQAPNLTDAVKAWTPGQRSGSSSTA